MITATADRLNIIINCRNHSPYEDCAAFVLWYSIYKHLPDANVSVFCPRSQFKGFESFTWCLRCDVPVHYYSTKSWGNYDASYLTRLFATYHILNCDVDIPVLILNPDMISISSFDTKILDELNDSNNKFVDHPNFWYISDYEVIDQIGSLYRKVGLEDFFKDFRDKLSPEESMDDLVCTAKSVIDAPFISYNRGCGRFTTETWLSKQSLPPFQFSYELSKGLQLTHNEKSVFKVWSQASIIYTAVK